MITYTPILRQAGGDLLNAEGTECIINEEGGVTALQIYDDMVHKYEADDPAFTIENDFANGRYTQQISGIYAKPGFELANPELRYGEHFEAVQLPQIDGGTPSTMLYAWCWTVNPDSAMQTESWKWIDFMSQHGEGWFEHVGYIQPRLGWLESEVAQANPALPVFLKDFELGQYIPRTNNYQEVEALLGQAIERTVMEGMSPQESLNIMKEEVDKLLAAA
jgi:ABC-type glycerol-3-phosphate transport system substrate-binding protein